MSPGTGQDVRWHNCGMPIAPSYDLHKLGWRAFQDLTGVILQSVLGQTFHTFADSNDGGRDGAFFGNWFTGITDPLAPEVSAIGNSTATVVQCKFSSSATGTLPPSKLTEELEKAENLHKQGLCNSYLLVTNLRVSGATEAWLRTELAKRGIKDSMALDGGWINQQISLRPSLRRYVPRVYGLGDLGQILNDRHRRQAEVLLARLGDDLQTFVPTAAYRHAADALAEHGFVLLLGAPAVGKSTIAATLAIAALDSWRCDVYRVRSADALISAWDPDEPNQLFWIDDAFGAIRHDSQLTDEWSRGLDEVMTAVKGGAKVVLTSRDYIYRQARPHLKEYAYPLLKEQQVVADVAELSVREKRRILYNHLKAGDQPASVLRQWRKHLPAIAASEIFQPEVARRLGQTALTGELKGKKELIDYMSRPTDFLRDILGQLDTGARAALGCVYLSGDGMPSPMQLDEDMQATVARLGSNEAEMSTAVSALEGTFLKLSPGANGNLLWQFRHPTIREGFAASIAENANAVHIFVKGLSDENLLTQVDCGGDERGTLVRVPSSIYQMVAERVHLRSEAKPGHWYNPAAAFLTYRCSDEFLKLWAAIHHEELPRLLEFDAYISAFWQPGLLGRLRKASALPEEIRIKAVDKMSEIAKDLFDGEWLDPQIIPLFNDRERQLILDHFRLNILPDLDYHIDASADGHSEDTSPADRFEVVRTSLKNYAEAFAQDNSIYYKIQRALASIEEKIADAEQDFSPPSGGPLLSDHMPIVNSSDTALGSSVRDEFDDVEIGH
jgi:hypothetical protein